MDTVGSERKDEGTKFIPIFQDNTPLLIKQNITSSHYLYQSIPAYIKLEKQNKMTYFKMREVRNSYFSKSAYKSIYKLKVSHNQTLTK